MNWIQLSPCRYESEDGRFLIKGHRSFPLLRKWSVFDRGLPKRVSAVEVRYNLDEAKAIAEAIARDVPDRRTDAERRRA